MRTLFTAACSLFSLLSFAQIFPAVSYPQGYFRDPLGIPMSLAANFGELRPNHYHMGLDIRTQRKENLPVFAAADGYVARVSIEPAGFGQAIYIRHPNGYSTVYGHLNKFFPALADYVEEQQYKLESWQVSLELSPGLFPVKKGDLIAYSGNTGGSQGPHLHFEIRRTDGDVNQNPLLFGLPVPDNTPPTILRLAYYDRGQGIYEQSPHLLPVHKELTAFSIAPRLLTVAFPRIGFAISAFDTQTGSSNPNGIYESDLYEDGQFVIGFRMNDISYDNTRNINAHIDYKTKATGGTFLQQLFFLQGYPVPTIYSMARAAGGPANVVIDLSDGRVHDLRIEMKDAYGNASKLSWQVQYRLPVNFRPPAIPAANMLASAVPAGKKFYPGMIDGLETTDCAFYLGEKSLYDSAYIAHNVSGYPGSGVSLPGGVSAVHTIGAPFIPLLEPLLVRLKPATPPFTDSSRFKEGASATMEKVVMVNFQGSQKEVQRPEWQGGWASARFREFGNFQLVEDREAPVITSLGPLEGADLGRAARIAFAIKDNLGALRRFRAELDGKWLCFTNDKGLAYIYKFDQHCPAGSHVLKVTVEDVAGNRATGLYRFTTH
jgi:murein DD-endopeptidase MepM/ murein hydrolase activator NlpD